MLPYVDEVFSVDPSRPPKNYVPREKVDETLRRLVQSGELIWLHGASKQGKSSLRHSVLGANAIILRCTTSQKTTKIYEYALRQMGCSVTTRDQRLEVCRNEVSADGVIVKKWDCDLTFPQDIAEIFCATIGDRYLVIEEFHYLSDDQALQFAQDLKTWLDTGFRRIIVTAAGSDSQRLIRLNSDLSGRIESISVDDWTDEDLRRVADLGFGLLQKQVSEQQARGIIAAASGSIYLAQKICREIAAMLPHTFDLDQATARAIRSLDARYIEVLEKISSGNSESNTYPYRVVTRRIIEATDGEIERGISREDFREFASRYGSSNATDVLTRIERLQERSGNLIAAYNYDARSIRFVDRMFASWLRTQDRQELARKCRVTDDDLTEVRQREVPVEKPMSSTSPLRILHLSDIHFGLHYFTDDLSISKDSVPAADKPTLFSTLSNSGIQFDLPVISGDLTQIGGTDEFAQAATFIKQLLGIASVDKNAVMPGPLPVVVVPGNHDINWSLAQANKNDRSIGWMFFRGFADSIGVERQGDLPEQMWYLRDLRPRFPVIMLGINSAVIENKDDHRGYIGDSQLRAAMQEVNSRDPGRECVRVAIFHHHLESVASIEQDFGKPDEVLRDSAVTIEQLHRNRFSLVMHGHRHHSMSNGRFDQNNSFVISGCGSSGAVMRERGSQPLEIRLITVARDGNEVAIHIVPYHFDVGRREWKRAASDEFKRRLPF